MRASSTARKATISAEIGLNVGLVLALFLWLPGCATPPTDPDARAAFEEANDPLEPTNRAIFDVNVALDDHIVKPVAEAYRVVPEDLRKGMHNMIVTVHAPVLFGNYLMQADPDSTADTVLRFLINITAGVGGFFDVASMVGVPTHDTDFGVTLAKWGVGEGFYLMLPGFGPSNPRDAIGLGVDFLMDPIGYFATLLEVLRPPRLRGDRQARAPDRAARRDPPHLRRLLCHAAQPLPPAPRGSDPLGQGRRQLPGTIDFRAG